MKNKKGRGWHNDIPQHRLASYGVKTKSEKEKMLEDVEKGELVHNIEKTLEGMADHPKDLEKIYVFEPIMSRTETEGEIHIWLEFKDSHFDVIPPRASGEDYERYINEAHERDEEIEEMYEGIIQSTFPQYDVIVSIQDKNPQQYYADKQHGMWKDLEATEYYEVYNRGD